MAQQRQRMAPAMAMLKMMMIDGWMKERVSRHQKEDWGQRCIPAKFDVSYALVGLQH